MPLDYTQFGEGTRKRDPRVSYMELKEKAGGFSCGNCSYLSDLGEAYCTNRLVQSEVSPGHGCCNLFNADGVTVVYPKGFSDDR